MAKLDNLLDLIRSGITNPKELAEKLGVSYEEVEGMIKILESMGYVEEIKFGENACNKCPLKSICPGSCIMFKGRIYQLKKKDFALKR